MAMLVLQSPVIESYQSDELKCNCLNQLIGIVVVYLEDSESSALTLLGGRPIGNGAVTTDTAEVQLQLTGDALFVVNNPQRLLRTDLDSDELSIRSLKIIINQQIRNRWKSKDLKEK